MLRDDSHQFRKMWAAEPWLFRQGDMPSCWDRKRDAKDEWQSAADFFLNT